MGGNIYFNKLDNFFRWIEKINMKIGIIFLEKKNSSIFIYLIKYSEFFLCVKNDFGFKGYSIE